MDGSYVNIPLVRLQILKEKDVRYGGGRMDSPKHVAEIVRNLIGDTDREHLVVCCVDAQLNPTCIEIVGIGTINKCLVSPREVLKTAVLRNAYGVVVAHNHPSGIVAPSSDDINVTERLDKAGEILGIKLIDHVIIGERNSFFSFQDEDMLSGVL